MNSLIKKLTQKSEHNLEVLKGGSGSGNFGHAGRPGHVGGSSSKGGGGVGSSAGSKDNYKKNSFEGINRDKLQNALKEYGYGQNNAVVSVLEDSGFKDTGGNVTFSAYDQDEKRSSYTANEEIRKKYSDFPVIANTRAAQGDQYGGVTYYRTGENEITAVTVLEKGRKTTFIDERLFKRS